MLGVFLVILAVMLGSFLGYHAWMIAEGVTTNETFKIKDYQRSARRRAAGEGDAGWNRASGERVTVNEMDDDDRHVGCAGATSKAEDASRGESASTTSAREGGALRRQFTFWRRRGPPTPRFVIAYHKGFRTNLLEVFFPPSRARTRGDWTRWQRLGSAAASTPRRSRARFVERCRPRLNDETRGSVSTFAVRVTRVVYRY